MKIIYLLLGLLCLGIGAIGSVLPLLPTFPFLLGAAFFFAKSSNRLHNWLIHTKMYQDIVVPLKDDKEMTLKNKIRIMSIVTILMTIGFICMKQVPIGRIVLSAVWVFHMYYFLIRIKTKQIELI